MQDPNYVISILGYEFNEVNRYELNAIFEKVVELVLNLCRNVPYLYTLWVIKFTLV